MNTIKLENFKAFQDELTIKTPNKNLLLYGENGAGKSSIFEALKITFHRNKVESSKKQAHIPEDQEQIDQDFWAKYNNKITNTEFQININGSPHNSLVRDDYQSFMISIEDIITANKVKLGSLLNNLCVDIPDIDTFCPTHYNTIVENVNNALTDFNETIRIDIDNEEDFAIKIIDPTRNIESKSELKKFFNEAKLNLVLLLIIFNSIKIVEDNSKARKIILDDFITSLDAANRTFLLKYIFEHFSDFQIFIFTHNVSFYNLALFMITSNSKEDKWVRANLYEINNKSKIYTNEQRESVTEIKDAYEALPDTDNDHIEKIGNRLRQKFEIILYELSKLISIGAVEESSSIIERVRSGKDYYYKDGKTANDLIDEIQGLLGQENRTNFELRLSRLISRYKNNEFDNLRYIIQDLRLYQKVTMHPMSHGHIGQSIFTTAEIKKSIDLLIKLEKSLKRITNTDIVSA